MHLAESTSITQPVHNIYSELYRASHKHPIKAAWKSDQDSLYAHYIQLDSIHETQKIELNDRTPNAEILNQWRQWCVEKKTNEYAQNMAQQWEKSLKHNKYTMDTAVSDTLLHLLFKDTHFDNHSHIKFQKHIIHPFNLLTDHAKILNTGLNVGIAHTLQGTPGIQIFVSGPHITLVIVNKKTTISQKEREKNLTMFKKNMNKITQKALWKHMENQHHIDIKAIA